MNTTADVGRIGERIALSFLRECGYVIYGCNVRLGRDEIDIVAYDPRDRVFVFAEVKARSKAHEAYVPELNLTPRKKTAMRRAARTWVAERGFEGGYRLDLLCVVGDRVTDHLQEVGADV